MANASGKFIVIEGLEGAGKSTAMKTVMDELAAHNISAITTREPGGTPIGEILRSLIKDPDYKSAMQDKTELLLFYSARIQLLEQVIKPALRSGTWVLTDRFELSSFAYQGGGRGISLEFLKQLSYFCLQGFKPDLTLYLDISPELGMQRAGSRGELDRIEHQSLDFFTNVHEAYKQAIKQDAQVVTVDACLPMDKVQVTMQQIVRTFIEQQGL